MVIRKASIAVMAVAILFVFSINTEAFGATELTEDQASASVLTAIENHKKEITVDVVTDNNSPAKVAKNIFEGAIAQSEIGDYYKYSVYDGYKVSYSYSKVGHYSITFKMNYRTTKSQEKKFEAKLNKTVKSLNLEGKSDYQKVKAIYQYITKNVKYSKNGGDTKYTAYAALCKKKAVCQGYSTLFYRMCEEAGVDAKVITGSSQGENHAWDIVEIKGKYYNVDSTWDAKKAPKNYKYFLKSNKGFKKHTRASEFKSSSFNKEHKMAASNY